MWQAGLKKKTQIKRKRREREEEKERSTAVFVCGEIEAEL